MSEDRFQPACGDETPVERIPPTAYNTAAGYAYNMEIPLALELYQALQRVVPGLKDKAGSKEGPTLEARYLMTDSLLEELRIKQVLELAAGLTPRGILRTRANATNRHVNFDLPEQSEVIKKAIEELRKSGQYTPTGNLFLEAGDVRNPVDVQRAALHFTESQPVAVVCEGLLSYFNKKEIAQVARGVLTVLNKHGGAWITPDVHIGEYDPADQQRRSHGINKSRCRFQTREEAVAFFEKLGFDVEIREYSDQLKNRLTSPRKLGLSADQVNEALQDKFVFILRPKS